MPPPLPRSCPACRGPVTWEENPFRPFCSERCRTVDLGKWATGAYRIPGAPADEEEGDGRDASPEAEVPSQEDASR